VLLPDSSHGERRHPPDVRERLRLSQDTDVSWRETLHRSRVDCPQWRVRLFCSTPSSRRSFGGSYLCARAPGTDASGTENSAVMKFQP
jgi:hypothetical protein